MSECYISLLDKIQAKTFRYKEKQFSDKINCGFIAQDVIAAAKESGIDLASFGIVSDRYKDGSEYALNYIQFIPIIYCKFSRTKLRASKTQKELNKEWK